MKNPASEYMTHLLAKILGNADIITDTTFVKGAEAEYEMFQRDLASLRRFLDSLEGGITDYLEKLNAQQGN